MVIPRSDIDWVDARQMIESGETYRAVADKYNTTHTNVRARCIREGWKRPPKKTLTQSQAQLDSGVKAHTTGVATPHRNDETAKLIVKALMEGASYSIAAHMAGISIGQLENWRKADERFSVMCNEARSNRAMKLVQWVEKAAERGDSKAAQWLLGKTYPEYRDDEGGGQGGITVIVNVPNPQPAEEKVVEGIIVDHPPKE